MSEANRAATAAGPVHEPEIDGLRALAIVPVVLYHAGWPVVPGGFVGVDVFFVISGYLITRILDREIAAGRFSLLGFYERRARRILPALFAVLLLTTLVAAALLLPRDLMVYGRSLLFTVLFASNVYFAAHTGYFDADANTNPLLHTWSLAVEEQFYLAFPLLLLALARLGRLRPAWVVAVVAIVSLAISVLTSGNPQAFYLPFGRAWELMAGALLALRILPRIERPAVKEAVSIAGLVAIVGTVLFVTDDVDFPGWIALVPVLGAVALLWCAPGTRIGRLLSHPLSVGIGLVSYSLYLWHWPMLVLTSQWLLRPLNLWESSAVVAVSAGAAVLSWRFIEQPFRNRAFASRRMIFAGAASGIVLLVAVAGVELAMRGLPQRISPEAARLEAARLDISPKRSTCHDRENRLPPERACALGADVAPTVAVWSDSFGVELGYALGELAAQDGGSVLELSSSACAPGGITRRAHCNTRNKAVRDYLLATPSIGTIIIAAHWSNDDPAYLDRVMPDLEAEIAALRSAGRRVVVQYPVPQADGSIPVRLAEEQWRFGHVTADLGSLASFRASMARTISRLDALVAKYQLGRIDPTDAYCPAGTCLTYRDGHVLYFDNQHPSLSGARLIAPLYAEVLRSASRTSAASL